jgi:hypothetical protein
MTGRCGWRSLSDFVEHVKASRTRFSSLRRCNTNPDSCCCTSTTIRRPHPSSQALSRTKSLSIRETFHQLSKSRAIRTALLVFVAPSKPSESFYKQYRPSAVTTWPERYRIQSIPSHLRHGSDDELGSNHVRRIHDSYTHRHVHFQ